MSGISITPVRLRAALVELRNLGGGRDNDGDAAAFFIDGLNVLIALLPPPDAPIDLPADTDREEDSGRASPAAGEEASPMAPAPAPLPDPAAEEQPIAEADNAPPGNAPPKRGSQGDRSSPVWPPARVALLRDRYPHESGSEELLADLNRIPAEVEIGSIAAVKAKAYALGLRLSPEALTRISDQTAATARAALAKKRASVGGVAPTPPEPSPAPQPVPEPPTFEAAPRGNARSRGAALPAVPDDKAEVFEAFDGGMTVRDAAAEFGLPMSTLSNWHAEWKLRAKGTAE